jgi:hypothetical protein
VIYRHRLTGREVQFKKYVVQELNKTNRWWFKIPIIECMWIARSYNPHKESVIVDAYVLNSQSLESTGITGFYVHRVFSICGVFQSFTDEEKFDGHARAEAVCIAGAAEVGDCSGHHE